MSYEVLYTGDRSRTLRIGERVAFRVGDLAGRNQCNTGIVETEDSLLLIDSTAQSPDEEIIEETEAFFKKPVTRIFFTHADGDHRDGLATLHRKDILLLAAENTLETIGELFPACPCPRQAVRSGESMTVGGVLLSFWQPPLLPAHSPWDLLVALPEDGVVFTGDFLVPPYFQYTHATVITNWVAGLEAFGASNPPATVLMGHGEPEDTAAALPLATNYTRMLAEIFATGSVPSSSDALFVKAVGITDEATVLRQITKMFDRP